MSQEELRQTIVTRRCMKADCTNVFNVPEESAVRYCCVEHDPTHVPAPPPKKVWEDGNDVGSPMKRRHHSPQNLKQIRAIVREGLLGKKSQGWMAKKIIDAGIRRPTGGYFKTKDVHNYVYQVRRDLKKEGIDVEGLAGAGTNELPFGRVDSDHGDGGGRHAGDVGTADDSGIPPVVQASVEERVMPCATLKSVPTVTSASATIASRSPLKKHTRLPPIALTILEDEAMDDAEKVAMLKVYGGIEC